MEKFEQKKSYSKVVDFLNDKYGDIINIEIEDSYYNMKEKIEPHMEIIELARKSMLDLGIEPHIQPIRGGTDGPDFPIWVYLAQIYLQVDIISTEDMNSFQ